MVTVWQKQPIFFWKVEIVDNAVALFVFDTYAIARKVIKLIKK